MLADDVDALGIPVVAGFCTHPHWDHLLWHPRFGDVPRYATLACAEDPEIAARLTADRAYVEALRRGEDPADARLEQDWLASGPHKANLEQGGGRNR